MDDTKTKLVIAFVFFTMFALLFSYVFRAYIPTIINTTLDKPSTNNVDAFQTFGALFKFMSFSVSSDLYILSIIIDAWLLIGTFLLASFILNR